MDIERHTAWSAVGAGAGMLGAATVRAALNQTWKLVMHEDPPLDPTSREVSWRDAILWTVASGVAVGLGMLIARRAAAAGWERLMGEPPPV